MCFVDAANSNIEIGSSDFEAICYKCLDCSSTFKAIAAGKEKPPAPKPEEY